MPTHGAILRHVRDDSDIGSMWGGFITAEDELHAASELAIGVEGYHEEFEDPEAIVRQFVDDGWRFTIFEIRELYEHWKIG